MYLCKRTIYQNYVKKESVSDYIKDSVSDYVKDTMYLC